MPSRQRYSRVRDCRNVCQPNAGFVAQLIEWAQRRRTLFCVMNNRKMDEATSAQARLLLNYISHSQQPVQCEYKIPSSLKSQFEELLYRIVLNQPETPPPGCDQIGDFCFSKLCYCSSKRIPISPSSQHMHPRGSFVIVTQSTVVVWIGQWCSNVFRTCASQLVGWTHMLTSTPNMVFALNFEI